MAYKNKYKSKIQRWEYRITENNTIFNKTFFFIIIYICIKLKHNLIS